MSNIQIPELLIKFYENADSFQIFHPEFEPTDSISNLTDNDFQTEMSSAWFGHNDFIQKGYNFHCFGFSGSGSQFSFLTTPENNDLNEAPVVILTDDGSNPKALAKNFNDFLVQLAEPYEYDAYEGKLVVLENPEEIIAENNRKFNEWLNENIDLSLKRSANEIFDEAQEKYPKTQEIIESFL